MRHLMLQIDVVRIELKLFLFFSLISRQFWHIKSYGFHNVDVWVTCIDLWKHFLPSVLLFARFLFFLSHCDHVDVQNFVCKSRKS